jgi:hypothetical protein
VKKNNKNMEATQRIYTRSRLSVIWEDLKYIFYINTNENDSRFIISLKKVYNKILIGAEEK